VEKPAVVVVVVVAEHFVFHLNSKLNVLIDKH
jgi:hypothetical protein